MLVLRRKLDEAIVINQEVWVRVLAVEGARVKLGISAPSEIAVVREELLTPDCQHAHLRHKQEQLARETVPEVRAHLKAAIARLQRSVRRMHPTAVKAQVKARPVPAR
jgi:carbon storage regulator